MKLVENLGSLTPNCLVLTGDGRREFELLRGLSQKYNGKDFILFFPFSPLSKKTGMNGLNSLKTIPRKYITNTIIYLIDGEFFKNDVNRKDQINNYLKLIGIEIIESISILDAFLIKCRCREFKIALYCIISGPITFIEEEIARLIDLMLHIKIDLSGNRNNIWKEHIKSEINLTLRKNKITIEQLIKQAEKNMIESAFPNICGVLRKMEENFQISK